MKAGLVAFLCSLLLLQKVDAQQQQASTLVFSAEAGAMFSSARRTPFWLKANQYGTVPSAAPIASLRLGSSGIFYRDSTRRGWSVGYGAELVGNSGRISQVLIPEAHLKVSNGFFEVLAGRRREVLGLVDSTLSSGSYAWSGNALPIPKIQIGTRGFAPLHFTKDLISINFLFAHGWFANTDSIKNSFLHQKAFYGRIGKPTWKVKLYGGILHNVQWGGRSDYLGAGSSVKGELPSTFNDYLHIIVAKQPKQTSGFSYHDRVNQFGNHVGSIDIGAEVELRSWDALIYYQHPFEDKSGIAFINFPDGLYGFRLKRRSVGGVKPTFQLNRLLVEFLTTMNQSGSTIETKYTQYQGIDDYFNNFQYKDGWSHKRAVMGTPFISRQMDVQSEWQNVPGKYRLVMVNNRIQVVHLGLEGRFLSGVQLSGRLSVSKNYGTYRNPFERSVSQVSGVVGLKWVLKWLGGSEVQTAIALDQGRLYANAVGGWISLRKFWKNG